MVDKLAKLTVHASHESPINRTMDYHPWKDENLCLSILGLVHKRGNLVFWFTALKILYIYLLCTVDGAEIQFSARETRVPKKSPCQTVNVEKNSMPGEGM